MPGGFGFGFDLWGEAGLGWAGLVWSSVWWSGGFRVGGDKDQELDMDHSTGPDVGLGKGPEALLSGVNCFQ